MYSKILCLALLFPCVFPFSVVCQPDAGRVQLAMDTSEADQVLAILALRAAGKSVDDAKWEKVFATEPYQRLRSREAQMAKQFGNSRTALTDEDFKKFVL